MRKFDIIFKYKSYCIDIIKNAGQTGSSRHNTFTTFMKLMFITFIRCYNEKDINKFLKK